MKLFKTKTYIALLIIMVLVDCGIGAFIANWREFYWDSLVKQQFSLWLYYIGQFSVAALLSCLIAGWSSYLGNIIGLHYRTKLTRKALELNNHHKIEGGAQRVQDDCNQYPQLLIQIITGLFRSLIMIFVFATIIFIQLPYYYLIVALLYALIGTLFAAKIAKPLINLNYINQVVEAKFRQLLTKINYRDVHRNNVQLYSKLKVLQYFQSFYSQITVIIPHILLLFVYFSGRITFGIFMQVASSIAELINSLSFFITSFDVINRFLSCRKRLQEIEVI